MSTASGSYPSRKNPSIDPDRSIIWRRSHSSATMSTPRVQRWTIARSSGCGAFGSNRRTYAAGSGPSTRASVSTVLSTLATRPNASAAAQNPTISWSAGVLYRRTI